MPTDTNYEREQTQEHAYFNGRINRLLSQLASEEAMSQALERERDEARTASAAWKRAAKHRRQMDEDCLGRCKYLEAELDTARAEADRHKRTVNACADALGRAEQREDGYRARIAQLEAQREADAAAEADAVTRAQEAERELRELREEYQ